MKRIFKYCLVLLLLGTAISLVYSIITKSNAQKKIHLSRVDLPAFRFQTLNGNWFTQEQADSDQLVVCFFHPECDHCHYQAKLFKQMDPDVQVLMISHARPEHISAFADEFQLSEYDHIQVLADTQGDFPSIFGEHNIPSLLLYKDQVLQKVFRGETKIEAILKILKGRAR